MTYLDTCLLLCTERHPVLWLKLETVILEILSIDNHVTGINSSFPVCMPFISLSCHNHLKTGHLTHHSVAPVGSPLSPTKAFLLLLFGSFSAFSYVSLVKTVFFIMCGRCCLCSTMLLV